MGPTHTSEVPGLLGALDEMMPGDEANVVFDLRELEGHNPDTKERIKTWLRENKPRLALVTVLVRKSSAILKMVTAVIGFATGVKIRVKDERDEPVSVLNL